MLSKGLMNDRNEDGWWYEREALVLCTNRLLCQNGQISYPGGYSRESKCESSHDKHLRSRAYQHTRYQPYHHTNIRCTLLCLREEVVRRAINQKNEHSSHAPRNCDAQQRPAQYSIESCVVGEETPDEQG
ncbi:hypothetical protein KCV07_g267, partial [Aureobasidium melanogenum]